MAPVESLSPEWFTDKRSACRISGWTSAQYTAMANACSAIQPSPSDSTFSGSAIPRGRSRPRAGRPWSLVAGIPGEQTQGAKHGALQGVPSTRWATIAAKAPAE